jgi:hypothetical protein
MANGKVVEGDFQSPLPGAAAIMPILTGACGGDLCVRDLA